MRPNRTKRMLREGKSANGIFLTSGSPLIAEILAHAGFDWVLVDLQHSENSHGSLQGMLQALSTAESTPLVRVTANDPALIQRALDMGAYGVVIPTVNTRAEAEAAVAATRYPPQGIRSWGTPRGLLYGGTDYFQASREELLVIVMLESRDGVANAHEIMSVPDVDGCLIGPNDLAISYGYGPESTEVPPIVDEAIHKVLQACYATAKVPGIQTYSADSANGYLSRGFRFLGLGSDVRLISSTARATLAALERVEPSSIAEEFLSTRHSPGT